MPPQRTGSLQRTASTKPPRSERTHEENQERAYIAASRRSDRSLEARVESARRASEIHKRRTGRSLRVTEADVLNEEMYEEEDDELHGYRNLGLFMSNTHMDRRFAAYYQHQMHMRNVVDQALQDRRVAGDQAMDTPHNQMYMGGYIPQHPFYMQPRAGSYVQPALHRQQPYTLPNNAQAHGKSMSMHIPPFNVIGVDLSTDKPVQSLAPGISDGHSVSSTSMHKRHLSVPATSTVPKQNISGMPGFSSPTNKPSPPQHLSPPHVEQTEVDTLYPFTAELPAESARFLAGQLQQKPNGYGISSLCDAGIPDVLSGKMFSQYMQPPNTFTEKVTDDLTTPITEDLFWQPKHEAPTTTTSSQMPMISGNCEQDFMDSLFNDGSLLPVTPEVLSNDRKLDRGIPIGNSLCGDTSESDAWEKYMDQEWFESTML